MSKLFNEVLVNVEKITKNERFITSEQLNQLQEESYVYIDDAGISGTGKGNLYFLYLIDKEGNKTDEELGEVVVID